MCKCERCNIETNATTMSMFNTQTICIPCREIERAHPKYEEACAKELEEVKKGNYNFEGIGWDGSPNPTPTFGNLLLGEGAVNLVSLFGYWHLHRVLNDKHYFGFSDHRIGLSIRTETADKVKDWTPREFKIWQSFTTKEGKLIEYWDEPYTESQIKSFGNLTLEELERWVERGT